jgi:hypothetical protein
MSHPLRRVEMWTVTIRPVRTISRKPGGLWVVLGSSETVRQAVSLQSGEIPKRQSDLHGDMQSQAEMTWPLLWQPVMGGVTNVPKVAKFLVG